MICIERLLGETVAAAHPEHGPLQGVVVGGFVSEERMGDVAIGALQLVVMLRDGHLVVVPCDGARRLPPRVTPGGLRVDRH